LTNPTTKSTAKSTPTPAFFALPFKSLSALFLTAALLLTSVFTPPPPASAATDEFIFGDPVANIYIGRAEARLMIRNLNFSDVPGDFWAKDAVTRGGALDIIKGYADMFFPGAAVTNEEALAFVIRALGMERAAQERGVSLIGTLPAGSPLRDVWSVGYLGYAQDMGLITPAEYAGATAPNPAAPATAAVFSRRAPATRERVADWIYGALVVADPAAFPARTQQGLYAAGDWESVAPERAFSVDAVIQSGIMPLGPDGNFRPKDTINRAEMAQTLKNMDNIYYAAAGILKKTGTVGGIKDSQTTATGSAALSRDIYVRAADGTADVLRYGLVADTSPQSGETDAVVLRDGVVTGLASLSAGDGIEYLVRAADGVVLYVQVTSPVPEGALAAPAAVRGRLEAVDLQNGTITVSSRGKDYTFPMASGLYGFDNGAGFVRFGNQKLGESALPLGSGVELRLINNVTDAVTYTGEPVAAQEIRGVVVENNAAQGYLTVVDPNGRLVSKRRYEGGLKVQKKEYYDMSGEAAYIGQVFPDYRYSPFETDIESVEPGDIVFLRSAPDDPEAVASVSAAASCTTRYGKILEFRPLGGLSSMLMEFENGQTAWYDVADGTYIGKNGARISAEDIQTGDWARLLINQAPAGPGRVIESVREMAVEDGGHYISSIVKGEFSGVNPIQNRLAVKNAETLTKAGWGGFARVKTFDISGKNTEYYDGGRRVSRDEALAGFTRAGDVYIALENGYAGEKVKKVTFRGGRDELLNPDTVLRSDGNGRFAMLSVSGAINADDGAIVVRNGRLIDGRGIAASDYATVALNGSNSAAVVQIAPAPGVSGVYLARGRVLGVNDGRSFKVQSMASLMGTVWRFTPVQREFAIDGDTVFLDSGGAAPPENFTGLGDASAAGKVYTVVADGARAARVVDAPFAGRTLRGVVYRVSDGKFGLKNVTFLDEATGKWLPVTSVNAAGGTVEVTVPANSVVVRNNAVVGAGLIEVGEQVRVMTDAPPVNGQAGMEAVGWIVLGE